MDVLEASLGKILEGSSQYVIPLYQRPYSWLPKNWLKLWEDILELAEGRRSNPGLSHFTGTLVLEASTVTTGLTKFLVVDGQQRLTTLSVLLAAIARAWDQLGEPNSAKRVREQYLINPYADSLETHYRLRPANFDEPVYREAVDGAEPVSAASKIDDAFVYFQRQLKTMKDARDLRSVEDAILGGLKFVTITAKSEDNVYRIFESINNTGIDLTQADLVRNLVFMRLGEEGARVHDTLWLPLVSELSSQDVETVFWIDAIWRDPETRKLDVYEKQKKHINSLSTDELFEYLKNSLAIAEALRQIRGVRPVQHPELQRRLQRFAKLNIPGTLSLAARILYLSNDSRITEVQATDSFRVLESYLVRRAIVAEPVAPLGGISARCAYELEGNVPEIIHAKLSTGRQRYITDAEIRRTITESPMYSRGRKDHLKLVLQWLLERDQGKDEISFDSMSIEHILPQKLAPEARREFSATLNEEDDVDSIHESLVHTLGNLTLTNYNSELSNSPFTVKREKGLRNTAVNSNRAIAEHSQWGPSEISARGAALAEAAINEWLGPDETLLDKEPGSIFERVSEVLKLVGPGYWTTYGDIAKVVGTASQVVGMTVSRDGSLEGAWRVLRAGGTVAPFFRWPQGSRFEGRKCSEVLESEGVRFSGIFADPTQRLSADELLARLGVVDESADIFS